MYVPWHLTSLTCLECYPPTVNVHGYIKCHSLVTSELPVLWFLRGDPLNQDFFCRGKGIVFPDLVSLCGPGWPGWPWTQRSTRFCLCSDTENMFR